MSDSIFDFLRFSLDNTVEPPTSIEDIKWLELLDFAGKHAIVGILFEGIKRLEGHMVNMPNRQELLKWLSYCIAIEKRNQQMFQWSNQICKEINEAGFACCVLKGQGNALMYPNKLSRTSGDIDLWMVVKTMLKKSHSYSITENRKEIEKYARQRCNSNRVIYHHIEFEAYKNCMVELHCVPCLMNNAIINRRFQKWVALSMASQFYNKADGYEFCIPTDEFNRIYQLCHIQHHYFDEGIGFRQLIDYYYLLKRSFSNEERDNDIRIIKHLNLLGIGGAVMYIMKYVFGLEDKYLLVEPDELRGKILLKDILNGGNLGKSYEFAHIPVGIRCIAKLARNMKVAWLYPSEVLAEPIFKLWQSIWIWKHN